MRKIELLSPVGDKERLIAAINYGCDAVYFAGKQYGLRAFGPNFNNEEISEAVKYSYEHNVKVYITVNILAHNNDLIGMVDYLKYLESIKVDGVIVSDLGIAKLVKENTKLELHVSTQANVTNVESAKMWVKFGAKRLVLARELNLHEIKEIKKAVGEDIDIECFVHGAMCISYSGRCLLSNYFTGRDSNKGECIQPCRWGYEIRSVYDQVNVEGYYPIEEDSRGTYILNSKDMCLIEHIGELIEAGITSFKIEGRMKSTYYVASTTNAYRRAIDAYLNKSQLGFDPIKELKKTSHRQFTTGFYFNSDTKTNCEKSKLVQDMLFIGVIKKSDKKGYALVEMRNKFKVGDVLEVLSPNDTFNKEIKITEIRNLEFYEMKECNKILDNVYIKTDLPLKEYDILRKDK